MSGTELDPDGTDSFHPNHPWEQTTHPMYVPPSARTTGNWPPVDVEPAGSHEAAVWAALPTGPTVAEPTVQVPMSLIEGHAAFLDAAGYTATAERMRALLSQPNPTSEPLDDRLDQWLYHDTSCKAGQSDWSDDQNTVCDCGLEAALGRKYRYV